MTTDDPWKFSGAIVPQFSAHIRQSLPLYEDGHRLIAGLGADFLRPNSTCYELGTSVGELTGLLADRFRDRGVTFVGIDREEDMILEAKRRFGSLPGVFFETADVLHYPLAPSGLVIAYYCLQFVEPSRREALIRRIYESLVPGGAFLWFEKIKMVDPFIQETTTRLYHDFKRSRGCTDEEILRKDRQLADVLIPCTHEENQTMLERAGFANIRLLMRFLCFEGMMAVK